MSQHGRGVARRTALKGLAGAAAVGVLAGCGGDDGSGDAPDRSATTGDSNGGDVVAALNDVPVGGAVITSAAVVVRPSEDEVRGFSSTCTHQSCRLSSVDAETQTISCACHGSQFSMVDGSVLSPPATEPLPEVALRIEGTDVVLA